MGKKRARRPAAEPQTEPQAEAQAEAPALRVRDQRIIELRVCDVAKNDGNHRTHPNEQRNAFRRVVERIGFYGYPDIFQDQDGAYRLVDGELRWSDIAEVYGPETSLEWNLVDFTAAEARLALASKDAVAGLAAVNVERWTALRDQIAAERQADSEAPQLLEGLAKSWQLTYQQRAQIEAQQRAALEASQRRPDDDELPADSPERESRGRERNEAATAAVESLGVQRHQLWTATRDGVTHRIYLGDCKRTGDVSVLLAGRRAEVVVTDPPYCAGGFQEAQRQTGTWGTIAADNLSSRGYVVLIREMLARVNPEAVYMFCDWRQWQSTSDVIEESGCSIRGMLVWAKPGPALGGLWRSQHELIAFACRVGGRREAGRAAVGNVLQAERTGNRHHYTEKPVDLIRQIIANESQSGREGLIYDPFGGSMTTVLAGATCGRAVAAMEVEPMAAAMGLRRLQDEGFELASEEIRPPETMGVSENDSGGVGGQDQSAS